MNIYVSKKTLAAYGWHIQKAADSYDKWQSKNFRPYVVGFCPNCESQQVLYYKGQVKDDFVFDCSKCLEERRGN